MKRLTSEEVTKIISLRREGNSISEISLDLKIPKTTIHRYVKNVNIPPKFRKKLLTKRGGSFKRKLLKEKTAQEFAKNLVPRLTNKELLLFISALYWAEGSKKDFGLSNTDPKLIRIFVYGLRKILKVNENNLAVSVRIYEDLDKEKCLTFWSGIVGVPKEKFIGTTVLQGKKTGKLEYGMCRIRVKKGGELLKKFFAINNVVVDRLPL